MLRIKSVLQKINVVREVGFGFGEVRCIILLVIFLPGRLDAYLEICVGINVLKIQLNRFKVK